jgi:hypothetical protein
MEYKSNYNPNHIPPEDRLFNFIAASSLLIYGTYGLWIDDLYIPGKRSRGIHLHNVPAWVMYGAIVCACIVMIIVIFDHYDKRDNEYQYKQLSEAFRFFGWGFFGLSLVIDLILKVK